MAAARLTCTQGWTTLRIKHKTREVLTKVRLADPGSQAAAWWDSFRDHHLEGGPEAATNLLNLAEELQHRGYGVEELYEAYRRSGTKHMKAVVHFMEYWKLSGKAMQYQSVVQSQTHDSFPPAKHAPLFKVNSKKSAVSDSGSD